MIHLKSFGKKVIWLENLFCSKHQSLTIRHNQPSSKLFHKSLRRSVCPPLLRDLQMDEVVRCGGAVLNFHHKQSVHMPLDPLFSACTLVQMWDVGIFLESGLSLQEEKSCDQKSRSCAALRACSCQLSLQAVVMSLAFLRCSFLFSLFLWLPRNVNMFSCWNCNNSVKALSNQGVRKKQKEENKREEKRKEKKKKKDKLYLYSCLCLVLFVYLFIVFSWKEYSLKEEHCLELVNSGENPSAFSNMPGTF